MNTKSLLLFPVMLVAAMSGCSSPNYAERFNYPAASIVVVGVHTKVRFATDVLKSNWRGSFGSPWMSVDEHRSARWDFVKKTDDGDVYLFHIQEEGSLTAIVPLLFSGKPITVLSNADILVQMAVREEEDSR